MCLLGTSVVFSRPARVFSEPEIKQASVNEAYSQKILMYGIIYLDFLLHIHPSTASSEHFCRVLLIIHHSHKNRCYIAPIELVPRKAFLVSEWDGDLNFLKWTA